MVPHLVDALKDSEWRVRYTALTIFGEFAQHGQ
jgi:hypothetical protein